MSPIPIHLFLLAFHIIGFIVWMAGLFYWIRIMVYQSENLQEKVIVNQLQIMSERLYRIIIVPGMILTWVMGLALMVITQAYNSGWFHFKLLLVISLTAYQFYGKVFMGRYRNFLQSHPSTPPPIPSVPSSKAMRLYNELATFLMVGVVLTVILRDFTWIAIGYGAFLLLLVAGFGGYWFDKRFKKKV